MPTSRSQTTPPREPSRRTRAIVLRSLVILVALVAIDVALTFVLEPYGANSESVWYAYRHETEPIDTLVIGSSVAQDAFMPEPLEERLGAKPFCLASPGQSLDRSLDAFQTALEDHDLKRLILGTSFVALVEDPWANASMTIAQSKAAGQPLTRQIAEYGGLLLNPDYFGKPSSLGFLAPFAMHHVDLKPSDIKANIRNRIECADPLEAQARLDVNWVSLDHGFCNHLGQLDTAVTRNDDFSCFFFQNRGPGESQMEAIERMATICEERGIEFVVAVSPVAPFEQLYLGMRYPHNMDEVAHVVRKHGGLYFDFSLAREDVYRARYDELLDSHHLNDAGARRFAPFFADVLARAEAGEDVSSLFYGYDEAGWDGYRSSIDEIALANFTYGVSKGHLLLFSNCYIDPSIPVEYSYWMLPRGSEDGQLISDWSGISTRAVPVEGHATAEVRMDARRKGSQEVEMSFHQMVLY